MSREVADGALQALLDIPSRHLAETLTEPHLLNPEHCYELFDRVEGMLAERKLAAAIWPAEVAVRIAARISRPLLRRAWDRWLRVQTALDHDPDAAERRLKSAIYGDSWIHHAVQLRRDAQALLKRGELAEAEETFRECLSIYAGLHRRHLRGRAHSDLARVSHAREHFDLAVIETDTLTSAWRRFFALRAVRDGSLLAMDLIDLYLAAEIVLEAAAVARDTLAELRRLGSGPGLVDPLARCVEVLAGGDVEGMRGVTEEARLAILGVGGARG